MKASAQSTGLWLLLGLGTADLAALNLWVLPSLVASRDGATQTEWLAATERARLPPAASDPEPAFAATAQPPAEDESRKVRPAEPPDPQTPTAVPADHAVPDEGVRAVITFGKGTWWVGPASRERIAGVVAALDPDATLEIDGYADASGPDPLNQRISRARSEAIAELLVRAGVDRSRLVLRAHGELPASVAGDDERDRRAELRVARRRP